MTSNAFTRKLDRWEHLSDRDQAILEAISSRIEPVARHKELIEEGEDPRIVFLLIEGWAIRYKILPDGKRQIVAILLPGDLCDIHIFIMGRMDHGIAMLTPGKIVRVPKDTMLTVIDEHPAIARALWWTTLVDEAVLREWVVNVGGRNAYARVAHLLCELYVRMGNVGLVADGKMSLPLTQSDLGQALGLTPVHVNRMLSQLRANGLVSFRAFQLRILDFGGLVAAAGFDPGYLHGKRPERPIGSWSRPRGDGGSMAPRTPA